MEVESSNPDKLFVAGVSWATTDEAFKNCFAKFGELTECQVMREPSGKSRGFGFVAFANQEVKNKVLAQQLQLDGRKLDIKPAVSKEEIKQQQAGETMPDTKKVWVAGLSYDTTDDSLFNYFATFGALEKASTMKDKTTGKSRGFGFVCFASQEVADAVLEKKDLELDGRKLEVKMAVPRGGAINATPKKCYVAGLSEATTDETLKSHFSQFGALSECSVQKGKDGKSRCFGFVTYESESSAAKAIAHAEHVLDGKSVDCKPAVPKSTEPVWGANVRPGGMQPMQAAAAMRMAAARQYQFQFQAMQAQAMQAQAQAAAQAQAQAAQAAYAAAAARAVQPQAAQFAGQYGAAATAQAFGMAGMNPQMNPTMNASLNAAMTASMNPQMSPNPAMTPASASPGVAYDRYPGASAYSAAYAAANAAAQNPQSYGAYGQENSRLQEERGAYATYAAQQAQRAAPSAADPYATSYGSYPEDYSQYGARRSTNRTVGYHPYTRV